ncbi:hypothetical protein TNCV_1629581 [Trichonephila clavipes]|uniref:Uncharacterized protein n=1 Tax=Trichonephila clavipes TaxID=2585209 RepID=A0A8X6WA83_TRICX|nr:hypothetical protein TNCV_1629581 [Trichonephila clavipes]
MQKLLLLSQLMKTMLEIDEKVNVVDTVQTPKLSHSERLKALRRPTVFEHGAVVMDVFVMKLQNTEYSMADNRTLRIFLKKVARVSAKLAT